MAGTLTDLSLKQAYHKPEDDIAHTFYLPCLAVAQTYDRAVGYFSSAIYALAWPKPSGVCRPWRQDETHLLAGARRRRRGGDV